MNPRPRPDLLSSAVEEARELPAGRPTDVYPALAAVPATLTAAATCTADGAAVAAGDHPHPFILMSAAKPFVLALAVEAHGMETVLARTGARATGRAFNDPGAITDSPDGRTNAMVNPGAITAVSLLGADPAVAARTLRDGLSAFAGRELRADDAMVEAIAVTNHRNRLLAALLAERGLLGCDIEDALRLYTLQSCLRVTVADLARMGAALATGGTDPRTGVRIVSEHAAEAALAAMRLAGLYEATDAWMARVGLPAKSGIAGGLVAVSPGRGAVAAYSPGLDSAGNPVRPQAIVARVAPSLGAA